YDVPKDENYIILSNHTGAMDPVMLAFSFNRPIFFVASDHISRLGIASKILDFLVAPIPIVKSKLDLQALREINKELENGNTVALFPSGSRSVSGPEEPIPPATSKLLKILKKPVLLYRIEGGYLSSPRWARSHRRGKMSGQVVRELTVADIERYTVPELDQILLEYLDANPYTSEKKNTIKYRGRNYAQYLERIFWHCPSCLRLSTIKSEKDIVYCDCGFRLRYDSTAYFVPASDTAADQACAIRFPHVDSFYQWQLEELKKHFSAKNLATMNLKQAIFSDQKETLILTSKAHKNKKVLHGTLSLYPDCLEYLDPHREVSFRFPLTSIFEIDCIGPQRLQFTDRRDQLVYESFNEQARSAYKYIETIKQIKSQNPSGR
ncbi:MAG: lysophospholipid acyltransferase family protein, partial [Eubacteriales bacterium]|nr:lysophospholipid acyltransferase family protein [Eubacteriales bacterium]